MSKVSFVKNAVLGNGFVPDVFLPKGETEYYIRNKQANASDKHWRNLTDGEIAVLTANANYSDDWTKVLVSDMFDAGCIRNSKFYGLVRIGDICCGVLQHDALSLPVGIYNSTIVSSDLGNNVALYNVGYLANYIIGNECILFNIKEMTTANNAKFGNGVLKDGDDEGSRLLLTVMNEAGGREISPFEDMITADAYMWAKYIDDRELQTRLTCITQASADSRCGVYGTIGSGTIIKNTISVCDAKVGECCVVEGANKLCNITIKSSENDPSHIGEGVILKNGIVGFGCHLYYSCIAENFVLGNNSTLKYGARLIDSFVGDNSTIACCEVLNNLVFPAHEQHHNNSFLIASLIMGQSNLAAGATVGSNHNSRTNDNEIQAGRGFWPGLCASLKHSCRFASYTLLAKAQYPAEIDNPFPFALISNNAAKDELEIMPAYWWMYNMYALARNSWKYTARDKRKHKQQHIEFNAYAPDTMEEAIYATTLLEKYTAKAWFKREGLPIDLPEEVLMAKGKELLSGDKVLVQALEILADDIEKGNRKVRLLKAYEAYHAYGDMMVYYAVTNMIKYFAANADASFDRLHDDLAKDGCRPDKWVNLGGQLVKEKDFVALIEDIKSKQLDSWTDIHNRYDELWNKYDNDKQSHAYLLLCCLLGVEKLSHSQWIEVLNKAASVQDYINNQVYASRKKDYDNPFRKATYRNDEEMMAAIGTIDENKFIVQIKDETLLFKQQIEELLSKLR